MKRRVPFAAVVILLAAAARAAAPVDEPQQAPSPEPALIEAEASPEPVFVAGIDSGGAGNQLQPGPGCKLVVLCVNDSHCRQIYPGFWACAWMESSACDSIYCESGE